MSNRPIGIDIDERADISSRQNTGWGPEQVDDLEFNQALFQQTTDHVWGTQAQTVGGTASFWTDASGDTFDKVAASVVFQDQDKILIAHDVTATADLLVKFGQKKVTIEMLSGITLDMDTFDLTLGESGDSIGGDISLIQTGALVINGNRGLKINNSVDVYEDFKTKNLIINVQNNTQVDADADNIIFIDSLGGGKRVDSINETFTMPTDLMSGTSEKASHQYQMWLDSDGVQLLVPDLEGTADSDVTTELRDSTATFITDKVQVGDIVYNLTDLIQGTVVSVDSETAITLSSDFFPDGDEDYKIRMLSPVGLGAFRARIGAAFNNSGSNLDDSTYTQIQEEKFYLGPEDGSGDFTVTGANWITDKAVIYIRQVNDWTGLGIWKAGFNIEGTVAPTAISIVITITGIIFSTQLQAISLASGSANRGVDSARTSASNNTVSLEFNTANSSTFLTSGDVECNKKPTFHN